MAINNLDIIRDILKILNISLTLVRNGRPEIPENDSVFRNLLLSEDIVSFFPKLAEQCPESDTVYYITDSFCVEYCILHLPKKKGEPEGHMVIGPYCSQLLTEDKLLRQVSARNLTEKLSTEIKERYKSVPIVPNIDDWRKFWSILCSAINDGSPAREEFLVQQYFAVCDIPAEISGGEPEARYAAENRLLKAVSFGNTQEALGIYNHAKRHFFPDSPAPGPREIRNSIIVFNTILRKAAEVGGVHSASLDTFSANVMKQAEMINTPKKQEQMHIYLIRRYCTLVQENSVQGCSQIIQKIICYIKQNINRDLSLNTLSKVCSVSPSYLSSLFKKEMNMNITGYINQQRILMAVNLLDSRNMQIQDVASECGIYDVDYFRKVFKRQMGVSPTEYLNRIKKLD